MKFFYVLKNYIYQHAKGIILYFVFALIFVFIIFLRSLPIDTILYSALLCLCIAVVVMSIDFIRYYNRHKCFEQLKNRNIITPYDLPAPINMEQQDYYDILTEIYQDKARFISKYDAQYQDMIDYYTLWVHQIKTPISAMYLLLQSDESSNRNISAELFKVEQYVDMVLSYLRLDSDSTDFVLAHYSLENIVKQAVRKYAPLFISSKIHLDLQPINTTVITDEKWLLFVLEQILSNSIKYTKKGKISIYTENSKTLVIKDTGIGISKEDLPRLCQKGFTGYNGHSYKKSTGLGLYLCKRILNKLSHTIEITSQAGVGTEVKINLETIDMVIE